MDTLKKYKCQGFRAVAAESMRDAAQTFADREARKIYGHKGYARTCTQQGVAFDGSYAEYEAFIGYRPSGQHNVGTTVGKNIRFSVYAA